MSRPSGLPDIAGDADDPAGQLRDHSGALIAVAGDETMNFAIGRSRDGKESKVRAALGETLYQVMQGLSVVGPHRPDEDGRPIPKDDVVLVSALGSVRVLARHPLIL